VARPVGSLLALLVAPLLFFASHAWRPGVTFACNHSELLPMSSQKLFSVFSAAILCGFVLARFNMDFNVTFLAPC